MAERHDKRRRKEALDQWMAQRRAAARAQLPLPDEQMQGLFDMLDRALARQGCDHSLRLVRGWLREQGLPVEPVEAWLLDNGGYCDCEALANAEQAWQDAIQDVAW
jgi:hypothetical protein